MLKVMIIDDEPFIREGLKLLIDWKAEGFEITAEAKNAFEAMEIMQIKSFDLFLIDIKMPKMNGIQLAHHIREKVSKKAAIVFLTGYMEAEYVSEAFDIQALQYLQKPVEPSGLLNALRMAKERSDEVQAEEERRRRETRKLREYYVMELLHGVSKPENIRYLKQLYRQEKELRYIQFTFNLKEDMSQSKMSLMEEVNRLNTYYQRRLKEQSYYMVSHIPVENEVSGGFILSSNYLERKKESIYEFVDRILEEINSMTNLKVVVRIGKPVNDIEKITTSYQEAIKAVPYMMKSKEVPLELRLNSYLNAHYMENITLKSLSEMFYVNAAYLGQFFKKHNGVYLKEYLNSIRVKKGAELLVDTNMKIYQIAEYVGFQSADSFISAFSKEMNTTPQKYRQMKSKEQ